MAALDYTLYDRIDPYGLAVTDTNCYYPNEWILRLFAVIIFSIGLFLQNVDAQNLIPNGDFEEFPGRRPSMRPWKKIMTIDFYYNRKDRPVGPSARSDKNYTMRTAKSGKGYVGMRIQTVYEEFLIASLKCPLEEGKTYRLKFFVCSSPYCAYNALSLGASLTKKKVSYRNQKLLDDYPPQFRIGGKKGVSVDKGYWLECTYEYVAKGGEKWLTIGCFQPDGNKRLKKKKWFYLFKKKEAYYYLDDFSLLELDGNGDPVINQDTIQEEIPADTIAENIFSGKLEKDSTIVLKDLYFDHNSSEILSQSYDMLDMLSDHLLDNPEIKIEITGHTDNSGTYRYNIKLSEARAKAVYDYLLDAGVAASSMNYKGMGEQNPVDDNTTPSGRAVNRRVEVKFTASN